MGPRRRRTDPEDRRLASDPTRRRLTNREREVALLVADGVEDVRLRTVHKVLAAAGAAPRFVGVRLGVVTPLSQEPLHVEVSLEAAPSVTWDAVVLPDGEQAALSLAEQGQVVEFVKDQYRHCKPMLVLGHASAIVAKAGIDVQLPDGTPDPGIVLGEPMDAAARGAEVDVDGFVAALAKHRHYERETDPPRV